MSLLAFSGLFRVVLLLGASAFDLLDIVSRVKSCLTGDVDVRKFLSVDFLERGMQLGLEPDSGLRRLS